MGSRTAAPGQVGRKSAGGVVFEDDGDKHAGVEIPNKKRSRAEAAYKGFESPKLKTSEIPPVSR